MNEIRRLERGEWRGKQTEAKEGLSVDEGLVEGVGVIFEELLEEDVGEGDLRKISMRTRTRARMRTRMTMQMKTR